MSEIVSELSALDALQASLRDAGAAQLDPVGWHYIEVLCERTRGQSGLVQQLLHEKRRQALQHMQTQLDTALSQGRSEPISPSPTPSVLAALLGEMAQHATEAHSAPPAWSNKPMSWRAESPRIQQFKKDLKKISVQMQVKQAIAQAPQNAGPINSHMLMLRSLSLMRDASPDYLNRFMTHVDTLLSLESAGKASASPKKNPSVTKLKK